MWDIIFTIGLYMWLIISVLLIIHPFVPIFRTYLINMCNKNDWDGFWFDVLIDLSDKDADRSTLNNLFPIYLLILAIILAGFISFIFIWWLIIPFYIFWGKIKRNYTKNSR